MGHGCWEMANTFCRCTLSILLQLRLFYVGFCLLYRLGQGSVRTELHLVGSEVHRALSRSQETYIMRPTNFRVKGNLDCSVHCSC